MKYLAAAICLVLAACGQSSQTPPAQQHAGTLHVENAWAAPTPGGVEVSAGYLTVVNDTSGADALIGASSPRAASVEVHEMTMDGGVMQMRAVPRFDIAAGESLEFAPGRRHLMFMGVSQPFAEGETIPVRLTFEHAGAIDVSLPVQRQRPNAGHDGH